MYCPSSDIFYVSFDQSQSVSNGLIPKFVQLEAVVNNWKASQVSILKKKNLITNISKVTDMYEVFAGSISHEKNWTGSVRNHDNGHGVAWAISMLFVWGINCHTLAN